MKFCERPFNFAYLAPNGEVWPCGWMHYPIGNLYEQDLKEIWHSEAAQRARESVLNGSFAYCRKTSCPFCERGDLPELSPEEIQERAVPSDIPERIDIANDRICNIACTTCRLCMFSPPEGEREKIDQVLSNILPYANRVKHIHMNGNGEFLANPSFLRFLENLEPEREDYQLSFETNGILFDEAHWARFSHLGKYDMSVTMTLNSLRRETYQYLSGGFDRIDAVWKNLRFLSKLRREGQINRLTVTMVVQECNFQEIPEYIQTLTQSDDFAMDQISLKPVYKWFGMSEETYWFKNVLNPMHPYHLEYLKVLENPCWQHPKVFDWGCHNLREARPHPLSQEKAYNRVLLNIYENDEGLSPVEWIKKQLEPYQGQRIGIFGDNDVSQAMLRLLRDAGAEIVFQLTWFQNEDGDIPKVSMQSFQPAMVDVVLLLDFYDKKNLTNNLRTLKFQGPIVTLEEFVGENNK